MFQWCHLNPKCFGDNSYLVHIPKHQSPMIFTAYFTFTNNMVMIYLLVISTRYLRKYNINIVVYSSGQFLWIWVDLEGNGTPVQYSCLENPMDGGAWKAAVHGVAEGRTRLSDFTFTFHFHALEKERATHSSVLAWRIPGMGEPGELPSMGSHRVGHDWSDLAAVAINPKDFIDWQMVTG